MIAAWMAQYDTLGEPRCGSADDAHAAAWLRDAAGADATLHAWPVRRIVARNCWVELDGARIAAEPLFDAPPLSGPVAGALGAFGTDCSVGWEKVHPGGASLPGQSIAQRRAASTHAAIIFATGDAGIAPLNAPHFPDVFGPPVVQVAGDAAPRLEAAQRVRLLSDYVREDAQSANVEATLKDAPDALVLTPRTSWFTCTAERGGGIGIWLDLLHRRAAAHFLATGGHELGHLGLKQAMARGLPKARLVLHLGANLGCAGDARLMIRSHDPGLAEALATALADAGYPRDAITANPPGPVGGEAHEIAHAGLPFLSMIGANPHFHDRADRLANLDVARVALMSEAAAKVISGTDAAPRERHRA